VEGPSSSVPAFQFPPAPPALELNAAHHSATHSNRDVNGTHTAGTSGDIDVATPNEVSEADRQSVRDSLTAMQNDSHTSAAPIGLRRKLSAHEPESPDPMRNSLESLAELERMLEEQHQQLVEKGYIPATSGLSLQGAQSAPRFEQLDINGDGVIDRAEWAAMSMSSVAATPRPMDCESSPFELAISPFSDMDLSEVHDFTSRHTTSKTTNEISVRKNEADGLSGALENGTSPLGVIMTSSLA